MSDYLSWVNAHGIEVMAAWYIFSAFVSSLPSPIEPQGLTKGSSALYKFTFSFMHTLAGSLGRIPYFRNLDKETKV